MITYTQKELDDAALLLIVGEDGNHKWSATKTDSQVVTMLRGIADDIEARSGD